MESIRTEVFQKKDRKYGQVENRNAKTNQLALISITILELLLVFALIIQTFVQQTAYGKMGIVPLAILILSVIINWVVYKRDRASESLKYVMMIGFLIGWAYLMLTGKNVLVTSYVYSVLIGSILYRDVKFEKIVFCAVMAVMIMRTGIWAVNGYLMSSADALAFISTVVGFIVIIVVHVTSRLYIKFTHDMLHSVEDEKKAQMEMIRDILNISTGVTKEVEQANELMEMVKESSGVVHGSIHEISKTTQITAKSVQQQSEMTSVINTAINETAENAKVMVETAESSTKVVEENLQAMNKIREKAQTIEETNAHVVGTMEELQKKAKEVQQITEVIFSISSQTNLLALNASIESARAGEAGRGFAVVADEIRKLSEETRVSTEQITGIVQELNSNAKSATEVVQASIDAMNQQNQMVESAVDGFVAVQNNMETLTRRIEEMNKKIKNLVESNDTIIENVNQLSAISERISVSAEEVEERSQDNQQQAQMAREALNQVQELVQGFSKYQEKTK